MTPQPVSKYTFTLAKCILSLTNAKAYADLLCTKPEVQFESKQVLRRISQRADAALRDFTDLLTDASRKVMQEELLPLELTKQLESCNDMFLAVTPYYRNQIETFIADMYLEHEQGSKQ